MKKVLTSLLAVGASLTLFSPVFAGPTGIGSKGSSKATPEPEPMPPAGCQCFGAGESLVDIFGAYAWIEDEEGFGGGIRYTKFVDRHFGFSFNYQVIGDAPVHDVSLSFVARAPIEEFCVAPYVYAGPGGYFNSTNDFTYHAGVGLDLRLFENCEGIFVDYRHTFADGNDYGVASLGYRFNF